MPGSELYKQYSVYLNGFNSKYPLNIPGAKTFYVAPSTYTAVGGIAASDGNLGEDPQEPLATIGQAHTNCVAERGDTICLLPGTHNLSANVAITKDNVRIVAYYPGLAVVGDDGTVTGGTNIDIDADDVEIAGIHFTGNPNEVGQIVIADTSATTRTWIHDCRFVGGSNANGNGITVGEASTGNDAAYVTIERCHFTNYDGAAVETFGSHCTIEDNVIHIQDGDVGVLLGDYGTAAAVGNRDVTVIKGNIFCGATTGGDEVAISVAAAEANTALFATHLNFYAHIGSAVDNGAITVARHEEGIGLDYVGTSTTATQANGT